MRTYEIRPFLAVAIATAIPLISCDGSPDGVDAARERLDGGRVAIDAARPDGGAAPDGQTGRDAGPRDADVGPRVDCAATDPAGAMECVSRDRYVEDVTFISSAVRTPGSTHWERAGDLCAATLQAQGFTVERHDYGTGVNIVGTLAGTDRATEHVVLGAHYDHIPDCLGADDNATGVAGVLELARVLSGRAHRRSLVVACWDEEERGARGSTAWANRAERDGMDIVQYANFDMIGFASDAPNSQQMPDEYAEVYREEFAAFEADGRRGNFLWSFFDKRSQPFARTLASASMGIGRRATIIQVPTALLSAIELQNSDHASFWANGWPAAHVGDTGELRNANYHCRGGEDSIATLNHDYAYDVIRAAASATWTLLSAMEPPIDTTPNITTCAHLCARAPFAQQEADCLGAVFQVLGVTPPASCGSVTGVASCNTCVEDFGLSALHCEGLGDLCF